jgi:serine protease Do
MKKILAAIILSLSFEVLAQTKVPSLKFNDPLPANAFVELAKLINPTVVNISTSSNPKRGRARDPMLEMLEQFYGFPMTPYNRPQQALGSGFIIRDDGLIVTNNHVISGADIIQVQLSENSSKLYEAKVIGTDERTDIALIKISHEGKLPAASLGSSTALEVGEWVAAFGNPFGQGHSMAKGIISAKGRSLSEINKFPLIQTDTPINPGNSGGPLVNLKGQVIGVNAAIDARAQGIGFAIPIDDVKSILPQLEKLGQIKRGFLGVGLADLDVIAARQLGLRDTEGAVIAGIERGSPADRGGLRMYDIVTRFNGKKITSSDELRDQVADAAIGSKVDVEVIREGKNKKLSIQIGERPKRK